MISVVAGGYTLRVAEAFSEADEPGCAHAALVERFDTDAVDEAHGGDAHIQVHAGSAWPTWPFLCVGQRYYP
ncbi:MAG: hypothetical protein ACXVDI_25005, partial [Ktedonobacterales bacterium]